MMAKQEYAGIYGSRINGEISVSSIDTVKKDLKIRLETKPIWIRDLMTEWDNEIKKITFEHIVRDI